MNCCIPDVILAILSEKNCNEEYYSESPEVCVRKMCDHKYGTGYENSLSEIGKDSRKKTAGNRIQGFCIRHIKLWVFLFLLFAAWIVSAGMQRTRAAMLQKGISREVLRFHVLANSDSTEDQQIKLKVRDEILEWLEEQLTWEEENNLYLMEARIQNLLPEIEKKSVSILNENGYNYGARVRLEKTHFPERTYGTCTFPAGKYTALRILLGEACGQNWWCILFPRLCFLDCVHAVLPSQSQEQLQNILTEEEYESLFDPSEDNYKISFRYF